MASIEIRPSSSDGRYDRFVVGSVEDFPSSGRLLVIVNGREVGIFKVKGEFFAVLNRCPHLGGPLCYGQVVHSVESDGPGDMRLDESKTLLTCPYHNWEFDLRTGQSYWDHNLHARPFAVDLETGCAVQEAVDSGSTGLVKGPYKAEMYEVKVEEAYLVLTLRRARARRSEGGMT